MQGAYGGFIPVIFYGGGGNYTPVVESFLITQGGQPILTKTADQILVQPEE